MSRRKQATFLAGLIFSVTLLAYPTTATPTPPVAAFTYTPTAPILGDIVVFDASASYDPNGGTILSYNWDFDDGTVITVDVPTAHHNYTTFGTYNVTLTITDDEAETDTTWHTVTVGEYPVAYFTYSPTVPIAGETATFNASLSTPNGGTFVSYTWDFGDGNITVAGAVITHTYTAPGNYTATLNVTDSEGLWDTESKSITIIGFPQAEFAYTPERPIVGETVTFNASLSTPNGGTIVSYTWDFGDGNNETGMIVTHVYTAAGNYTATLTITDSEGLTDTAQTTLTVRNYPVAFFDYTPKLPLVNETVNFDASLSNPDGGTIISYTWDFGDGSLPVIEADPKTTHVYTAFGTHNVSLIIMDSEDLSDTFSDTIRILIAPVANFTHSPIKPIINETVTFDASASYDPDRSIVSYTWDFGDGNITVAGAVITHAYTAEGTYNVTLTVTDDEQLTDTVWKLVTVYTFLYVHDVAITNVTISATEVYVGRTVNITVVAKNVGTAVETFNVTVYRNATSAGTQTVTNLLPGEEATVTFSWDTTGVTLGTYLISVKISSLVLGEIETDDGYVKVKRTGDVNGDGVVNVIDVLLCAVNMGSVPPKPPEYDINDDGTVNVLDVILCCVNMG